MIIDSLSEDQTGNRYAPVAQWIEQQNPDLCAGVRLLSGAILHWDFSSLLQRLGEENQYDMKRSREQDLYDQFLEQIFYRFPLLRKYIIFYFTSVFEGDSRYFQVPHRKIGDMMLMYGILWRNEKREDCLIPVTDEYLTLWRIGEEELFRAASENTPRLLPVCLCPMREMLHDFLSEEERGGVEKEIYVLTNKRGYLGAAALLYENVLSSFSARVGADLYILPSSIHEVLLLPVRGQEKAYLQEMVEEINKKELQSEDILSNRVYQYLRKSGKIVL